MSSKITTLNELLTLQLKDIFSAESQLLKALPKMAKAAQASVLRDAFESHLDETKHHLERLEQVGEMLNIKLRGHKCVAMEGLINEGEETIHDDMDPQVRDAALICAAQRVEHYEIAAYGCARTFAELLGFSDAAQLLTESLEEEGAADKLLTQIAMEGINAAAINA